jgi:GWxTD domain-containing protein
MIPRAAARFLVLVLVWAVVGGASAGAGSAAVAQRSEDLVDWINPLLGPRYAQWLVGPQGRIATEAERKQFLALASDDRAAEFVEAFWASEARAKIRPVFDRRVAIADGRFSEAAVAGSRTDRGTLFVLYGEPEDVSYEQFRDVEEPDVELWSYPKDANKGLDGLQPRKLYRFAKDGDLTRLFRKGGPNDPAVKRRRSPGYRGPPP